MSAACQLALPFIGLFLLVLVHAIVHRARRLRNAIFRSFFLALPVAMVLLILLELCLPAPDASWPSLLVDLGIFTGLAYIYLEILSFGCSSIRLRIMAEIHRVPAGLTAGKLLERYNARTIIELRLERLLGSGAAREACGRIHDAGSVVWLQAAVNLALRRLFFGAAMVPPRDGSTGDVVAREHPAHGAGKRQE